MGNHYSFFEDRDHFDGYNMKALKVDEAYLTVHSQLAEQACLYALNEDCVKCPFTLMDGAGALPPSESTLFTVNTKRGWDFVVSNCSGDILDSSNSSRCSVEGEPMGEFGVYELNVTEDACDFTTLKEPVFEYAILIFALLFYVLLFAFVRVLPILLRKLSQTGLASCFRSSSESESALNLGADDADLKKPPAKPRVKSLDTFRGLSIALMIFVNYNAGQYWFMEHSTWDGLYVADLVFPWFLWIMGVCIPMGLKSAARRKVPKFKTFLRIVKRSLKLFMLGLILNSLGGWVVMSQFRIPGVLQRFAICYLVVSSVALYVPEIEERPGKFGRMFSDVIALGWQWLFYLVFVAIHLIIIFCLPVPGCPTGYLGPGGLALLDEEGNPLPECVGGATGLIDRWLLGKEHLYQNPTSKFVYDSGVFDPEGVFGSMQSIFQVFLGLVAGTVLQYHKDAYPRMIRWLVWCVICGVIGTILCFAGDVDAPIPVNKNLWSLSYVMVTSCFAFFLLALFYLLVDELKVWSGSPLYQAGMNSIFLYVGHNVAYNLFPWHYIIGDMVTHMALLIECLWGTSLWIITALYLHSIGKFYTV